MNKENIQTSQATLYYDSECPLCCREIGKLKYHSGDSLSLVPIKEVDVTNLSKDDLYNQLHVKTVSGEILKGFDANCYVWRHTKYAPIAKLFGTIPLLWLGRFGYSVWLRYYHYQRRKRL